MKDIYLYDEGVGVQGPFTEREIMNAARRKDRMTATHFCSDLNAEWLPMTHFLYVLEPNDSLARWKELRFEFVRVIASGTGADCPACLALAGIDFPIQEAPVLPPVDCSCYPWCRSLLVAVT